MAEANKNSKEGTKAGFLSFLKEDESLAVLIKVCYPKSLHASCNQAWHCMHADIS